MDFTPYQPHRFISDISHHNDDINFGVAKQHVGYFIARTGDGHRLNTNGELQGVIDRKYKQHVAGMKAEGIKFGNYMFNRFSGVVSARQEAEYFWQIGDKDATIWFCDAEVSTAPNMLECIQAFVDRLRELGAKRVGLYIGHHKYQEFGGQNVKNIDCTWIPRYGAEPAFSCDLWQFTEYGQVPGIGKCDLNVMKGDKDINWYKGTEGGGQTPSEPEQPSTGGDYDSSWFTKQNGVFTLDRAVKLRTAPFTSADVIATLPAGSSVNYNAYGYENKGYVWIRQPRGDKFGYLATGETENGKRISTWGTFK